MNPIKLYYQNGMIVETCVNPSVTLSVMDDTIIPASNEYVKTLHKAEQALFEALEVLLCWSNEAKEGDNYGKAAKEKARTALAKAKGESHD